MVESVGQLRQPLCQHSQEMLSDHGVCILGEL